jgi:hypothetical protein
MNNDITNNDITKEQLEKLDELLVELNKPIEGAKPDFLGDDELMIAAVTNAARYVNGEENTFLDTVVHIKSSYN